jgi:hypothetical protein
MIQESGISSKRTRSTYALLRGVSWHAHELAQRPDEQSGRLSNCMTCMLFSAFCLEAYLNHLGEKKISYWDSLKRKLSPIDKLNVLADVLGFKPDIGRRPYQTFKSIFKLRDLLVHGKTETLIYEREFVLESDEPISSPIAEWEQHISLENATRFLDDTKAIIYDLNERAGFSSNELFAAEIAETKETRKVHPRLSGYSSS